jgi:UPF0755 protein
VTAPRGPQPGFVRSRGPERRSTAGPLAFLLVVIVVVAAALVLGRPLLSDVLVAYVSDHPTLLRQGIMRTLVADRVRDDAETAKDPSGADTTFVIARGDTAVDVSAKLEEAGLVRSALGFAWALYDMGEEDTLQAGTYRVSPAMTPRQMVKIFQKASAEQVTLTIIEGWRLTQIADAVAKAFPAISAKSFLDAAVVGDRTSPLLAGLDPKTPLEGFLFPDTYFFRPDATAKQIVDTLLAELEKQAGDELRQAAVDRKMKVHEVVALASIVEREARDRSESATIAGVYQNRLDLGMKLDADPTIQYALGDWRELTLADLELDSPYNTYRVGGLPPTPICSAGRAALDAAASPAKHDYLYFVAKNDGTGQHAFAKTLEEQEANRTKYGNK